MLNNTSTSADKETTMRDQMEETADLMRFQQSLLRLVSRGTQEQALSQVRETEQTRQLEVLVRKVRPERS